MKKGELKEDWKDDEISALKTAIEFYKSEDKRLLELLDRWKTDMDNAEDKNCKYESEISELKEQNKKATKDQE